MYTLRYTLKAKIVGGQFQFGIKFNNDILLIATSYGGGTNTNETIIPNSYVKLYERNRLCFESFHKSVTASDNFVIDDISLTKSPFCEIIVTCALDFDDNKQKQVIVNDL